MQYLPNVAVSILLSRVRRYEHVVHHAQAWTTERKRLVLDSYKVFFAGSVSGVRVAYRNS